MTRTEKPDRAWCFSGSAGQRTEYVEQQQAALERQAGRGQAIEGGPC